MKEWTDKDRVIDNYEILDQNMKPFGFAKDDNIPLVTKPEALRDIFAKIPILIEEKLSRDDDNMFLQVELQHEMLI